jgi:transmembrane sensor
MSDKFSANKSSDVTAEACAWIAQLESESMTSDDLAAYKEWVERSPAHKQEIQRLAVLSSEMNLLTEMAQPLKEAATRQRQLSSQNQDGYWSRLRLAGVALIMLLSVYTGNQYISFYDQNELAMYSTEVGDYREITLSDGTVLELNTDSQIEIDYSEERRKVRLLNGEAFFQVAHNANRPFIVYANEKAVRAVGTAFVVRLSDKALEVLVTEGKVELSAADKSVEPNDIAKGLSNDNVGESATALTPVVEPIFMRAGETIVYKKIDNKVAIKEKVQVVSKREIKRKLSWQDGLLDFSDTPLIEVVEDLSRYTSIEIEILDPELRDLKFGGLFRTNELQALFNALETTFDIQVEKVDSTHVRLSRKVPTNS